MTDFADRLRSDKYALIGMLEKAGAEIPDHGGNFCCPFHEDRKPSSHVFEKDGAWKFRCFTCDMSLDYFDVQSRIEGRPVEDIMSELANQHNGNGGNGNNKPKEEKRQPKTFTSLKEAVASIKDAVTHYAYTNPDTRRVDLLIVRTPGKEFPQFHQDKNGRYITGACEKPWPIYNRGRVRQADTVVVVEGEKDVHTLHDLDIVATTSPGGANNGDKADWSPLAGKQVIIWPDNDDKGMLYLNTVGRILETLSPPPVMRQVVPAYLGLGHKDDVTDFMAGFAGLPLDERKQIVRGALEQTEPMGAAADLSRRIEDVIAGRIRAIVLGNHIQTSKMTQALLPGTITLLCGSPGASKSLWLQEVMMTLDEYGEHIALYHLEEDRAYHLRRAMAQLSNCSEVTDEEWVRTHPNEIRAIMRVHESRLSRFGTRITDSPNQTASYEELTAWADEKAKHGARVLTIDPITLADKGKGKPWEADRELMARMKAVAVKYGCSIILVTHPSKSGSLDTSNLMDRMAGGAAFQRAAQNVFWLELHEPLKDVKIKTPALTYPPDDHEPINRTLHILKARNGIGTGLLMGFFFDKRSLRHRELGVIIRDSKRKRY